MKKTILILFFISWQLYTWSQVKDKIITKNGETIICRIDSLTATHIYFSTVVRNILVQTYMEMNMVSNYQPYILTEEYINYNEDKLFINEELVKDNFIDFSKDEPFIKKNGKKYLMDFSQDKLFIKKLGKGKTYNSWVTLNNTSKKYKGVLYEVNDSYIVLAGSEIDHGNFKNNYELMSFQVNNIKTISTRRKKNAVRGVWIGAVSGFGASLLLGLAATGSLVGVGMTGAFYGIPFAAIGAGLGAIIASIPLGIPIHGDLNRYNSRKKILKRRSLYR